MTYSNASSEPSIPEVKAGLSGSCNGRLRSPKQRDSGLTNSENTGCVLEGLAVGVLIKPGLIASTVSMSFDISSALKFTELSRCLLSSAPVFSLLRILASCNLTLDNFPWNSMFFLQNSLASTTKNLLSALQRPLSTMFSMSSLSFISKTLGTKGS